MGDERKKNAMRVESEGTVEVVAERNAMEKKKKKNREKKDSFAGEDGEIAAREGDVVAKKKSKKKRDDSVTEDDAKKSKKTNRVIMSDSEDDNGGKKSKKKIKEKKASYEAGDDGGKKSKKKIKEKTANSEADDDGGKKSKKKSKEISTDSEVDDGKKKKSKRESGDDEIGTSEGNQRDEKSLVNSDDAKRKTGKRKRDGSDLGDDENTGKSNKEMKRKNKKKKPSEDPEVEENNKDSAKDAKKKSKEKKLSEDSEVEDSTKDAKKKSKKKKPNGDPEVEKNKKDFAKDAKKKRSKDPEAEGNDLNSTKDAKKRKKKQSEDPEAEENNNEDAKKKTKKSQKGSKSYEDVTTPSSKSTKKVKFSDQVEVFRTEDEESEEEGEEVELVRGKRFTKEEDELIKKALSEYIDNHALGDEGFNMIMNCKSNPQVRGCWKEIASALPWRPYYGVYNRARTLFEAGSKGVWTKEDFELVIEFQKKHGNDWRTLADAMGKHRKHVKDAWRRIRLAETKNKGHWSRKEYQDLFDLVNTDLRIKAFQEKHAKHGMLRDNIPWMAISDQLGTRDHVVCCNKWYDQLISPMVAKGIWANVDDYRLLEKLTELDAACVDDVDWDNLLDNRDGEACRKRWNQMVLHIGLPGSKTFAEQVEILSQRYCPELAEDREDFDNRPYDPED